MKKIVILYHADCHDGFGAAWAARKKFGSKAQYIAVRHQEPAPPGLKDKEVYFLDFTYFGQVLKKILKDNLVTTIDHHIGAKAEAFMASRTIFSNNNSGSVLSWKFFHPGKPVPKLLLYIEDQDIWRFRLPKSKQIMACLDLIKYDFGLWDKVAKRMERAGERDGFAKRGAIMLTYQNSVVENIGEKAKLGSLAGQETWIVNSPILKSEIGARLAQKSPHVALIWNNVKQKIYVALRSNGTVDVTKLAKIYGGGGHKASSGFVYPAGKKFPWRYT